MGSVDCTVRLLKFVAGTSLGGYALHISVFFLITREGGESESKREERGARRA